MEVVVILLGTIILPIVIVAGMALVWHQYRTETRRSHAKLQALEEERERERKTRKVMEDIIAIKSQTIQKLRS